MLCLCSVSTLCSLAFLCFADSEGLSRREQLENALGVRDTAGLQPAVRDQAAGGGKAFPSTYSPPQPQNQQNLRKQRANAKDITSGATKGHKEIHQYGGSQSKLTHEASSSAMSSTSVLTMAALSFSALVLLRVWTAAQLNEETRALSVVLLR